MPVTFQVRFDDTKARKAIAGLRHVASTDFVRSIPLDNFAEWLKNRLVKESPKGGSGKSYWVRWLRAGNDSDAPWASVTRPKFSAGWSVARVDQTGKVTFVADHQLLHMGTKGRQRYLATLYGSNESSWTARRDFKYKVGYRKWVTVKAGTAMKHGATEGTDVKASVQRYIETFLLPRIGSHVTRLMTQKIA